MTKNRWKKIGILCLVACLCVSMFACSKKIDTQPTETKGEACQYTIEVATEGGMAMEGVGVYVYEDDTMNELVWFARTDSDGRITFTDAESSSYVAVLKDVPEGYELDEYYPVIGETTRIVLAAALVSGEDLTGVTFKLGDVMYDLSVTAVDGTEYQISELLADKDAVVLNFWYVECTPCRTEFPYLQEAYEKYSDKIAVLALNPVNQEDEDIAAFQKEMGLTFPMAKCSADWQNAMQLTAYPTTVVIDRFGTIAMIHKGSITSTQAFEDIFAYFTDKDYEQTTVENLEDIRTGEDDEETITNPTEIGGVTSFQLTVKPGEVVYIDLYKITKQYLTVNSSDVYVIYQNKTYQPSGGSVSILIQADDVSIPVPIGVGNTGDKTQTFTINLAMPKGSIGNPYTLALGEFTVNVGAGNDQGVFYTYTATETGVMSVQCLSATAGVPYDYTLYNLTTYSYRNLQSDAAFDGDGNTVISVKVRAGDTIQFIASALPDSSGTYPSATFKFLAKVTTGVEEDTKQEEEKIPYAVTVTDEDRKPISGVQVYLTVGDSTVTLTTNDKGVAATQLVPGTYSATIKVPAGYKAKTTEYQLTQNIPTIAVKMDKIVVETATYTVRAVDESGAPVKDVLVSIGGSYGYTNASGTISFTLPKDAYTAVIGAPDGYYADASSYNFASGATSLTVTLKKGGSTGEENPDDGSAAYTVNVTDYFGNAMSGVTVTFLKDGTVAGLREVDANGSAVMNLPKDVYTVSLSFGSGSYYCDTSEVVLSDNATSVTIVAVPKCSGEYEQLYVGDAYYIPLGATYVDGMQANVTNFFLFEPTQSGVYKLTTSDPSAVISFWGSNTNFIFDQTSSTDYADNAFTITVKEENIGNFPNIFGVTGAEDCIIIITRVGDVYIPPEEAAEWIIYEATTAPKSFKLTLSAGQSLTYVNLAGKTSDYQLVKGADGYYHLKSTTGPIMYVNLGLSAPYLSFYEMVGKTELSASNIRNVFYDDEGNFVKKEDYFNCMLSYVDCIDATYGVYPLTDDLIYIIQNCGEYRGWWDVNDPTHQFVFGSIQGLNSEINWMFACCYVG